MELLMNYTGVAVGLMAFLIIGIFHPIVIIAEYHFTERIWPVFLAFGILTLVASLFVSNGIVTSGLGVLGCSILWSIRELKEQTKRVEKGWFPANPKRKRK